MKVLLLNDGGYTFFNTKEMVYPLEVEVEESRVDGDLVNISKEQLIELGFDGDPCYSGSLCWILGSEAVVLKGEK